MKILVFALSLLSFGLVCCSKSKPTYCVVDAMSHVEPSIDSLTTAAVGGYDENELKEFATVVDTLNSTGDPLIHSSYFLYDITGDGEVELWINSGSCEADKILMAFTIDKGKPRKIYEGDGGHSDYFIYKGDIVCVMCNTGAGVVITYKYDGNRVTDSMIEFSTWNDSHKPLPKSRKANPILEYWDNNYDKYIEQKDL